MNEKLKYWLPYFFLWTFCYLFYPTWLVPGSPHRRYVWLLSFLVYFGVFSILYLKKAEITDNGKCFPIALLEKRDMVFGGAALVFVLLHIYPVVFLPLRTWTDEPSHASSGIQILQAVSLGLVYSSSKFRMLQWISRLIVLAGIVIAAKYKPWKYLEKFSARQKIVGLMGAVFLLSHLLFFLLKDTPFYLYLYKPPPLSRWLSLGVTTLAQPNVFWVRLPSLIFCILSSALIYEIVALLGYKGIGRIAAVVFLFFPNVSHYSSSAVLGCGTVFFSLLPLYFLMYFLKSKNYSALHWCFFWAAAGFLWKRPLITGELYLILILCLYHIFVERISLKQSFTYWLFSLGMVLPLFLMGQFFIELPFWAAKLEGSISFSSLFHPEEMFRYLSSLPKEITFAGLIVFAAGLLIFVMQRAYLSRFWPLAISFLCWYIVLSLTVGVYTYVFTQPRWQLPLYPFIALCSAFCFRLLIDKWRKTGVIAFSAYLFFMVLCSTFLDFSPLHPEYAMYRTDLGKPAHLGGFLPYEKMILYMKEHLPPGSKVVADDFPDPREFYSFKHHLNVEWKLVKSHNELLPEIEGLYRKAKLEGASYLFLPEPAYLLHIDDSAANKVFEGDATFFPRAKVFSGRGGRVGLFSVKE